MLQFRQFSTSMMRRSIYLMVLGLGAQMLMGAAASSQPASKPAIHYQKQAGNHVAVLTIVGSINAGTADYVQVGIQRAFDAKAAMVVLEMDTPGGFLQATRSIVKAILNAPLPIAVFVTPSGARAGSAGVFITMAGHIAAMSPGTNIGAAHPVTGQGKDPEKSGGKHMAQKIENDTVAFIEAIAKQRKRNIKWGRKAVLESASITSDRALKINVIDFVAPDLASLLKQADGMKVQVRNYPRVLATKGLAIRRMPMTVKQNLVNFFANPNIAYLLMMIGMAGIAAEFYHPGAIFPGMLGAICLFLGFIAMQVLPINYGGLALIILGLVLFAAELFTPAFGLLFMGGVISLTVGSIFLIDSPDPSLGVSLSTILPTVLGLSLFMGFATYSLMKSLKAPVKTGMEGMIEAPAIVYREIAPRGTVELKGELWSAESVDGEPIKRDEKVTVVAMDGLTLTVKRVK